ncbi:MAG: hypothetical protein MK132_16255 [Lentisphaerales bacterium]|nr:hypothetical protein [Lentisphaerales bacterium]
MRRKAFLITLLLIQSFLQACDVPVFRYALERWERDLYRLFVVHQRKLNEKESELLQQLNNNSLPNFGHTNYRLYDVDLNHEKIRESFQKSFPDLKDLKTDTPKLILRFPFKSSFPKEVIWQGELNQENVDKLLNSKATEELMKGILQGYSSTFLLMESGDQAKDQKIAKLITQAIEKFEKELKIPKGVVQTDGNVTGGELTPLQAARRDPSNVLKSGIPLKINFNFMRMPNNGANKIFRNILSKTHDPKQTANEPKLYAFFGRGRLLGPMVGDEITSEELTLLAEYLCGACSCQMKQQNPGLDFLTNLDWTGFLEGSEVVVDKTLPPLIGVIDMAAKSKAEKTSSKPNPPDLPQAVNDEQKSTLSKNLSVTLGLVLALIIGGTFIMRKK